MISAHVRSGKRIHEGTVVDICEDGCFVVTQAVFQDGAAIQLRFRHPRTDEMVKARAVVARRVRPGEGRPGLGLTLVDTLSMLEPSAGATASTSGTWSRPELLSRSGTWRDYDSMQAEQIGVAPTIGHPVGERRGVHTEDTGRPPGKRTRLRVQIAGARPCMGLLLNASEGGFAAAAERCPPVGKLLRIELTHDGHAISITAKAVWRSDIPGGMRSFGAKVLKFAGSDDLEAWQRLLTSLRA